MDEKALLISMMNTRKVTSLDSGVVFTLNITSKHVCVLFACRYHQNN